MRSEVPDKKAKGVSAGPSERDPKESASDELLTPKQVARILGVSTAWVRDHATRKQPRLPMFKVGKLQRFRRGAIKQFLEDLEKLPPW